MQKIKAKGLHICKKCGNVMVTRIVKRGVNPKNEELEKILQCIVCRHWKEIS